MQNIKDLISEDGVLSIPDQLIMSNYENHHDAIYSLVALGSNCFNNLTRVRKICIPASVINIDWSFYECWNLESIHVDSSNPMYCDVDGVLYNKQKTELIAYPNAKGNEYHVIEGVTTIRHFAFKTCNEIEKIYFPSSVKSIEDNVFYRCDRLKVVYLPDGIEELGNSCGSTATNYRFNYKGKEYTHQEMQDLLTNKRTTK